MIRTFKVATKTVFWISLGFVVVTVLLVSPLRWINPPTSAVIIAWEWGSEQKAAHNWQPIEDISPRLQIAVIASEDQKFPSHYGFDIESIQKALNENNGRPRGASTITQQVAKNLFLWNGRSYIRKAMEAWFTLLIEWFWSKQRILEVYLNIAEFGEGVYGAEAAAQDFYGVSAKDITQWQAGLLVAVLPSPKKMSAKYPSAYVEDRGKTITEMANKLGGVSFIQQLLK